MKKKLNGKAQTVLGLIDSDELGFTLPHEHLIIDLSFRFVLTDDKVNNKVLAEKPVCLENINWIQHHWFGNKDNLKLGDKEMITKEVLLYKSAGGRTIVDMTNRGLGRDPQILACISRATGLNIIMGSGYYMESNITKGSGRYVESDSGPELRTKTEDEIVDDIVKEIIVGTSGICPGVIGEIGADSWPLSNEDTKSLRASARAQHATGAPLNIHPGRIVESHLQILQILGKAGADLSRVALSHMDRHTYPFDTLLKIAKTGCYIEFDLFGKEGYFPQQYGLLEMPNDAQRVNIIIQLIDKGYLNQILISHDICMKMHLNSYGGHGYAHILENVIPWMRAKGISEKFIQTITVDNPKRFLTFVAPSSA